MLVAHDDWMEGRDLLVPVDDRVAADVCARVEREIQISEDRREVVVVVPPDQYSRHAIFEKPQHLLHLDPLVDEVLRELVLEVPRDDDLLRFAAVEHLAQPLEDDASLEARDRAALLCERPLEAEMKIGNHEGPLVAEEKGEVARRLDALRDLDAVHPTTVARCAK